MRAPRKHLERALSSCGPPALAHTCIHTWLLFTETSAVHSGRGTLHQVHADWHRLLDALSPQATIGRQPIGMWLTVGAQLLEVGSQKISCKSDVPRIPPSHAPQWIRLADPSRQEIHLRNESRSGLRWLSSCFSHDQLRAVRQAPHLHCLAAADAVAEGSTVGIRGWLSTSQSFAWFSEQTEVRQRWPHLTIRVQAYVACFETVAQLALAMTAVSRMHTKHFRFVLPSASNNTAAEAGINRLFTTSEPLSGF